MSIETEAKILERLEKLEEKFDQGIKELGKNINDIKVSQARLTNDNSWIKWLFGGLLSFILILLSIIISLLFKLVI